MIDGDEGEQGAERGERERERKKSSYPASFPKWTQWLMLTKARNWISSMVSDASGRGPGTWTTLCCFLRNINKELKQKQNSWDLNQCPIWVLVPLVAAPFQAILMSCFRILTHIGKVLSQNLLDYQGQSFLSTQALSTCGPICKKCRRSQVTRQKHLTFYCYW